MASDPRQPGPNTRISNWLGSVRWKGSDFATHSVGFPRGLLEEITDDDTITVMRCLTGEGKSYRATAIQKMLGGG